MVKGINSKPTPSEPLGNATPRPTQSSVPNSPEPTSSLQGIQPNSNANPQQTQGVKALGNATPHPSQSSVPASSESTNPAQSSVPNSNVAPQQTQGVEPLGNVTSHAQQGIDPLSNATSHSPQGIDHLGSETDRSTQGIDSLGTSTAEPLPSFVDDDVEFPSAEDETLALPVSRVEPFVEGDFVPLEEPESDTAELRLESLSLSDRVRVSAETDRYRVGDDYVALMVAEPDVDVASVLSMSDVSGESDDDSEEEAPNHKKLLLAGICGAVLLVGVGALAIVLSNGSNDSNQAGVSQSSGFDIDSPTVEGIAPTPTPSLEGIPTPEEEVPSEVVVPTPTVVEALPTSIPTGMATLPVEGTKESLLSEAKNWNPFADNSAPVADLAITVDSAYPAQSGDVIVIGQGITVPYQVVNCPESESCAPTNINPSKNNGNTKGDSSQYRLDFGYMSTAPVGDYDATKVVDAINSTIDSLSMPMDKISTVDLNSARAFSSGYALVPVNDVFFIIGKSGIMQSVKSYGVVNYPYNGVGIEQTYADLPSVTLDNLPKMVNNSADATSQPSRWVSPR